MKVIFRSNDDLAKKELGLLGGAEEWLSCLEKYVSESAIARLSLFIDNGVSFATLDIIDGMKHIHSSQKCKNSISAIQTAIKKCASQLKKSKFEFTKDTLRYNDEYSFNLENSDVKPKIFDDFEFVELEDKLSKEKDSSKYKKTINKYINYLYRNNDIERILEHLRILYSIYYELDKEKISVADYERLLESINELTNELEFMLEKQECFENNIKDNAYIDYIISEESKLAKLKK